jgi:hypothetical protein
MAVSNYFDNFTTYGEQNLINELGIDYIKQRGIDIYYMPRSHVNIDELWLEDTLSQFTQATLIEVLIKNFQGWQGEGDLMSKFGISMADQITFSMMRSRWDDEFTNFQPTLIRPSEGDFIYLPMTHAIFEVKFVEHESVFYHTGTLTFYDIKCERVNYSNEKIATGVGDIDNIQTKFDFSTLSFNLEDGDGDNIIDGDGNIIIEGDYDIDNVDPIAQNGLFTPDGLDFLIKSNNPLGGG